MTARWGVLVIVAVLVGGWSGAVVGQPTTPVAQTSGTSGSGGGGSAAGQSGASGAGDSGGSAGGDSGGSGGGDSGGSGSGGGEGTGGSDGGGSDGGTDGGGSDDGTDGGGTGTDAGGTEDDGIGTDDGDGDPAAAPPAVEPSPEPIPEDRVAEGEPTDCGPGARCYTVDDADAEGVRVPDGSGGFVVVPIVAVPVVDVDTGASTSAASNVDLQVRVDNSSGDVRVERRVAGSTQLVYVTLAALVGLFVGAAVLGTFLRFRRGPVS